MPPLPLEWTVDADPADQPGDAALFAGTEDNLDRSIVREVDVPAGTPALTFDADWSLEEGFDYGYVQVSTDGGDTYETIPCSDQVEGPLGSAFNGESDAFLPETCDLSAFAGQTVVIAFRMVTDSSVHFDGFWVDDVAVDGTVLSDGSTLDRMELADRVQPDRRRGLHGSVIVAYEIARPRTWPDTVTGHGHGHVGDAWIATMHAQRRLRRLALGVEAPQGDRLEADVVSVLVTYHDSTEQVQQYAPYTLGERRSAAGRLAIAQGGSGHVPLPLSPGP